MESEPQRDGETTRIPWHAAFVEAIQVELKEYKGALEFYPEYQLSSELLRIDCVVVKKTKNIAIKKNIAAIFRQYNLLEYKNPDDYVSVADFYKVYGYACLYASFEKVPISSMSVSFVESRRPQKLFKHLSDECGYTVEERAAGIYIVKGDILPIQVIDSRQLSAEENLWLNSLDNRLEVSAFKKIDAGAGRLGKEGRARLQAYLYALAKANPKMVREAMQMSKTALTLKKVLEDAGWIAQWQAEGAALGRAEGEARGKTQGQLEVLTLLKNGKTIEEAERILGLNAATPA